MSKKSEEKSASPTEEILSRIQQRVASSFTHVKKDKIKKAFKLVPNVIAQTEFVENTKARTLFFVGDTLSATLSIPGELPENQKIVYFLKFGEEELTMENFTSILLSGECVDDIVRHLQRLLGQVFVPLISNQANQNKWGEVASNDVTHHVHTFLANVSITLGQMGGTTALPLPPTSDGKPSPQQNSTQNNVSKRTLRVHRKTVN